MNSVLVSISQSFVFCLTGIHPLIIKGKAEWAKKYPR